MKSSDASSRNFLILGIEHCLLILPAAVFLTDYFLRYDAPVTALVGHVLLVFPIVWALLLTRTLLMRWSATWMTVALVGLFYWIWTLASVAFYGVVVVGLDSWGMVPTWPMLVAYFPHWRELLSTLGLAPAVLVSIVVCAGAGWWTLICCWLALNRPDASRQMLRNSVLSLMLLSTLAIAGFRVYQASAGLPYVSGEPLMLALNPQLATAAPLRQLQRNSASVLSRPTTLEPYTPPLAAQRRNIILIVGDALRADRMSLFGHQRKTTPYLDHLEATGRLALKVRAHSICAESLCGLMGISRSLFVHELPGQSPNLAQVLRHHGYEVRFILGGDHTNFYGLADALGPSDYYWDGTASGEYVNDDQSVVAETARLPVHIDRPIFIQFHLMSTHALGNKRAPFRQFSPVANHYVRHQLPTDLGRAQAWVRNFYDNGMLQFDHTVREIIDILEQRGYLSNALVIITSDHGEMLGEHGVFGHAYSVRQPALDIPLLMLRFGYEGHPFREVRLPSQVDIAPSILAELETVAPAGWSGRALQLDTDKSTGFSYFQQGEEVGLIDQRDRSATWKFWINLKTQQQHVYRLDIDPSELQDFSAEVPYQLRQEWVTKLLKRAAAGR